MTRYYKQCHRIWISFLVLLTTVTLSACGSLLSSKMPPGSVSMTKAYQQAIEGGDQDADETNSMTKLRTQVNPLNHAMINQDNHAETQALNVEFPELPNPSILMYVYPHFVNSGHEQVPVPGYFTAFHLYDHNYYFPRD